MRATGAKVGGGGCLGLLKDFEKPISRDLTFIDVMKVGGGGLVARSRGYG